MKNWILQYAEMSSSEEESEEIPENQDPVIFSLIQWQNMNEPCWTNETVHMHWISYKSWRNLCCWRSGNQRIEVIKFVGMRPHE